MDENFVSVLDVVNHPFMPPNTKSQHCRIIASVPEPSHHRQTRLKQMCYSKKRRESGRKNVNLPGQI